MDLGNVSGNPLETFVLSKNRRSPECKRDSIEMFHVRTISFGGLLRHVVSLRRCRAGRAWSVTSECYVMSNGSPRLGHVEPRERAGAQTGRKYEYQYERTARAALDLLADDTQHVCVYCDWHDDYVIEIGLPATRYFFHQVKGRKSSQGPWKFS